jgi:hypothetical protein
MVLEIGYRMQGSDALAAATYRCLATHGNVVGSIDPRRNYGVVRWYCKEVIGELIFMALQHVDLVECNGARDRWYDWDILQGQCD